MPIESDARKVYRFLIETVIPRQIVTTYQEVNRATGVPFGVEGGYLGQVLGRVFEDCDRRRLPPITSVVVKAGEEQSELFDRPRNRYGMPSSGYFVALAASENCAGRATAPGLERWLDRSADFDKSLSRYEYQEMVQAHQESVWRFRGWPSRL